LGENNLATQERRQGSRYNISFPIRVAWKDEHGREIVQDGLTENVGQQGTLIFLPRTLPAVGSKVNLTITENPEEEVSVTAQVIRLERNAAHPAVEEKSLGIRGQNSRRRKAGRIRRLVKIGVN
jgi:hypothetical protein